MHLGDRCTTAARGAPASFAAGLQPRLGPLCLSQLPLQIVDALRTKVQLRGRWPGWCGLLVMEGTEASIMWLQKWEATAPTSITLAGGARGVR